MQYRRHGLGVAAIALAALVASACSDTASETPAASGASQTSASAASPQAPGEAAHNDADVAFAQGMIPHHQQAIEMSDMLLGKQGVDPAVASLAEQIKAAQGPEIEQMQGWLQEWGVASSGSMPGSMPGHDMPGHDMPGQSMPGMGGAGHGMMSAADMAALADAPGAEAGRLFLTQMIAHHEGAITMAQDEIDNGRYPDAVEMARTIVTTQQQEIDAMRELLEK